MVGTPRVFISMEIQEVEKQCSAQELVITITAYKCLMCKSLKAYYLDF